MDDDKFIEAFLEKAILPHYKDVVGFNDVKWISHGKVNLDSWAHYFNFGDTEYALVYEDSPGDSYLADGLTHEVVILQDGNKCLELRFSDKKSVDSITGWYTLFKEKRR